MKILVVGGGGREHTIIWKLAQSPRVTKLYCAPGNAGISSLATCVPVKATDVDGMVKVAKELAVDMVMVAPDDPLALGMVDAMEAAGIRTFGPYKNAAILEASKAFSKDLMKRYNIPTAGYEVFETLEAAAAYVETCPVPVVVKADGLALGKGVIIAVSREEAREAVKTIMSDKAFGTAGNKVVIEEFMTGPEVTVLAFVDGKTVVPMVSSQDHKRAYDNDEGLNTGGMGTFSPSKVYTSEIAQICEETIFKPTIAAMQQEGRPFKGVIYFGLMLTPNGPKVVEYNARFGDPETQVILTRLKTDLVDIFDACIDGTLDTLNIAWEDNAAVCVVMASGGYPGSYETGYVISGLEQARPDENVVVFHAGTKFDGDLVVTSGGRVLGVTAVAGDIAAARASAYAAVGKIEFTNMHYRTDIGVKNV